MKSIFSPSPKRLILILASTILSACSTTHTSLNSARRAPNDRILAYQNKLEGSQADLTIIRDHGIAASGCYYAVFIDEVLSARLDPSEKATFHLAPGNRSLKITRDPLGKGLCSFGDDSVQKDITLEKSEEKIFRLSLDLGGQPDLKLYEQ